MDKKKTIACSCLNRIDVSDKELFSKVKCKECGTEYPVCGFIGHFIFEEKLSENKFYSTYKGFKEANLDEKLIIKLIADDSKIDDEKFAEITKSLNRLPEKMRLFAHEVEGRFIFSRKYQETSLEDYLKSSRPRSNKAVAILQESADILKDCTEKGIVPASLSIGNLLMDETGKTVLSDLLFKETISEVFDSKEVFKKEWLQQEYLDSGKVTLASSVYSFGRMAKFLCCGSLDGEIKLDLRDGEAKGLKDLIEKTLEEPKEFNSFRDISVKLSEILNPPKVSTEKAVAEKKDVPLKKEVEEKKKTTSKKEPVKTTVNFTTPAKNTTRPRVRKRRRKNDSMPVLLGVVLLVAIGAFAVIKVLDAGKARQERQVLQVPKDPVEKKKPVVKKEVKKAPKKALVLPPKKTVVAKKTEPIVEEVQIQFAGSRRPTIAKPTESKEKIKEGLIPKDFNFDPLNSVIDQYIAASESRDLEGERIDLVSTYRDHLLYRFDQRPYHGLFHIEGLPLFRGKVLKSDPENLLVSDLKTGKELKVSWDQLKFEQFNEFADYYAAAAGEEFSISDDNEQVFKKVADEYKRLAVFLHWYGKSESAVRYKAKASRIDDTLRADLDKLVIEAVN